MGEIHAGEKAWGEFPAVRRIGFGKSPFTHIDESSRPPESSFPSKSVRLFQYSHSAS